MLPSFLSSAQELPARHFLNHCYIFLSVAAASVSASGLLSRFNCTREFGATVQAPPASPVKGVAHHHGAQYSRKQTDPAKLVHVEINGRTTRVPEGSFLLEACRSLGIKVPTLCAHPSLPARPGTCRVCLVEADQKLQPACATRVREGMKVVTDSWRVRDSVRSVLALMQAAHPPDCMNCNVNGRCEFQDLTNRYSSGGLARRLQLPSQVHSPPPLDHSDPSISIDFEKCIKCGRCVAACGVIQEMDVLGMVGRGRDRHPAVLTQTLDLSKCIECGQCAAVCPVGAIVERSEWREVMEQLESRRKVLVCMTAPAVRVALGEELGLEAGAVTTGQMVTAQRQLGFDYVFDVNTGADLTVMEEGWELLQRLKRKWGLAGEQEGAAAAAPPLPLLTSCCPAWVALVEKEYPELIPHLSTCRSPQGMMGAVVKHHFTRQLGVLPQDVCLVSVMPCTAKKGEAERGELRGVGGGQDVDYVVTTREMGRMLRHCRIPLASLPEDRFDSPLGEGSGAGQIFGNTGGVMEAALRTAYKLATGHPLPQLQVHPLRGLQGVKEATITLPPSAAGGGAGREVRVAVASGVASARHLLDAMRGGGGPQYDFVEVMACPGGCIGGGGQPKTHDPLAVPKRMAAVYGVDERAALRNAHDNPAVQQLYKELLDHPGSPMSHHLLHTRYTDRSRSTVPPYAHAAREAGRHGRPACIHHPAHGDQGRQGQ